MIGEIPAPDPETPESIGAQPPLEAVLREVARDARLLPFDDARFPKLVEAMAAAYNDGRARPHSVAHSVELALSPRDQLAARLGFWFPRDLPKVQGAVREAIAIGRIDRIGGRSLRVLDIGAGLGASHRGLARALRSPSLDRAASLTLEVLAVDDDRDALTLAGAIAKKRPREGDVEIRLERREQSVEELVQSPPRGRFDVVLFGQVLSELDLALALDPARAGERVELHAERIASVARDSLAPKGLLVIVEPALRARSRHMQRVRGALIARGLQIVSPCLHEGRCPLLGREGDWCHEDLPVDLPPFLVPIAKRAGLRWQGLTFSHLVIAQRGPRLVERLSPPRRERAVSGLLVTKGKKEIILCGDRLRADVPESDPLGEHGTRIGRLDRAASATNERFDELVRGDVVRVGPLDEKLRLGPDSPLELLAPLPQAEEHTVPDSAP